MDSRTKARVHRLIYKKYNNKSRAARELQIKYKHTSIHIIMGKRLHAEFTAMREKGMKVKVWWFHSRAKQLMHEMYPKAEFTMSNAWFQNFKHRFHISLRRPTNTAQSEEIMEELSKPCLGYNQILTSFRENPNIGLAHAYKETNNFENNHTLQLATSTNVISPEKSPLGFQIDPLGEFQQVTI